MNTDGEPSARLQRLQGVGAAEDALRRGADLAPRDRENRKAQDPSRCKMEISRKYTDLPQNFQTMSKCKLALLQDLTLDGCKTMQLT